MSMYPNRGSLVDPAQWPFANAKVIRLTEFITGNALDGRPFLSTMTFEHRGAQGALLTETATRLTAVLPLRLPPSSPGPPARRLARTGAHESQRTPRGRKTWTGAASERGQPRSLGSRIDVLGSIASAPGRSA